MENFRERISAAEVLWHYPFNPISKPERLRVEHLRDLKTPTLIVQGERDAFGNKSEVVAYELSPSIQVHWLPDYDHRFTPQNASGRTEEQNWEEGRAVVEQFTRALAISSSD